MESGAEDRLSKLPASLLYYILSFLPTKAVVRTSLLSKRWESIWTEVNSFDFGDDGFRLENGKTKPEFVDFINWVLIRNKSEALEKFCLKWDEGYQPIEVEEWVSYAIASNVKVLNLSVTYDAYGGTSEREVHLPFALFISKTLETLELDGPFSFKVPNSKRVYLPKLTQLVISRVMLYVSDDSLHKFLCGCPVLSSFRIQAVWSDNNFFRCHISSSSLRRLSIIGHEFDEIEIGDAPALEYLFLQDEPNVVPKLSFKGLPALCEVEIDLGWVDDPNADADADADAIVKAVQAMHCTEFLKLSKKTCLSLTVPLLNCLQGLST